MLKLLDLAEHLGQQWTDRCGQLLRRLCKVVGDASARDPHSKGNCDAKLAQQPSKGVEVAMSRAHPLAAQPMQNQDLLLLEGLCRHGAYGSATGRLDQRRRVRTVSLVAPDVLAHVLRGQQLNRMPVCADPACPVVRTAAGLHEHAARRAVHKEGRKPCPIEP